MRPRLLAWFSSWYRSSRIVFVESRSTCLSTERKERRKGESEKENKTRTNRIDVIAKSKKRTRRCDFSFDNCFEIVRIHGVSSDFQRSSMNFRGIRRRRFREMRRDQSAACVRLFNSLKTRRRWFRSFRVTENGLEGRRMEWDGEQKPLDRKKLNVT